MVPHFQADMPAYLFRATLSNRRLEIAYKSTYRYRNGSIVRIRIAVYVLLKLRVTHFQGVSNATFKFVLWIWHELRVSKWRKYPQKMKTHRQILLRGRKNTDAHDKSIICNVYETKAYFDTDGTEKMEKIVIASVWTSNAHTFTLLTWIDWQNQAKQKFDSTIIIEIDACFVHFHLTCFNHIQIPNEQKKKQQSCLWFNSCYCERTNSNQPKIVFPLLLRTFW